ncbi:MAG TPA: zinc ABC transporter substrate-binding protein, partial [Alphaproteobacteria bacterium]|nr:zinc ABC transporter substrate-binding protein [Alphaproteobacteria bacterium]
MIRIVLPARTRQRSALPRPLRAAFFAIFAGALVAAPAAPPPARQAPQVAVTIKPIHGLVSLVMAGVADPVLLISGADSPHTHTVRPSEARALEKADIVFWIGSTLETSFTKPIAALVHGKVVSLLAAPGMTV